MHSWGVSCTRAEWWRPVTRARAKFRSTSSCEGLGSWPALPWLQGLATGVLTAVEACDEGQAGSVQGHSWRGLPQARAQK